MAEKPTEGSPMRSLYFPFNPMVSNSICSNSREGTTIEFSSSSSSSEKLKPVEEKPLPHVNKVGPKLASLSDAELSPDTTRYLKQFEEYVKKN